MAGKTIGYARTATTQEDISPQAEALKTAGCSEIYCDEGMPSDFVDRSGLSGVLHILQSGDTLKVENLDRIARSSAAFADFHNRLGERTIRIVLLDGNIETTPLLAEIAMQLMPSRAGEDI